MLTLMTKKDKSQTAQLFPIPHAQVLAQNKGFAIRTAAMPLRHVGEE